MDDEREEFLDKLCDLLAEARERMTPIERVLCDIGSDQIMEKAHNRFWIRYCLKEPGKLLLTKEQLQEKGREVEMGIHRLL